MSQDPETMASGSVRRWHEALALAVARDENQATCEPCFRRGYRAGYDARDEEVAALKAEVERLRAALRRLIQLGHAKDCTESRTEPCNCGQAEAVAALEDRKAP